MDRLKMPSAMPAEIAERLSDKAVEELHFDEYNDALMHDIMGNERLAKPIQDLLISLSQIERTDASFGADAKRVIALIVPQLKKLREACIEEMRRL